MEKEAKFSQELYDAAKRNGIDLNKPGFEQIPARIIEGMIAAWEGHPKPVVYPQKKVSKTLEVARRLKGQVLVYDPKFLM